MSGEDGPARDSQIDDAASPARRSPRVTAAAIGAAATLVAALTGLVTASQTWFKGDSSATGGGATASTTETSASSGAVDHLLYSHALTKGGPFRADRSNACVERYERGLRIEVTEQFVACDASIHAVPELAGLPTVRIEATAIWSQLPDDSYEMFGAGGVGLHCRGNGEDTAEETYYDASLTSTGHWEFSRYVDNTQKRIALGDAPELAADEGQSQQLRFDCTKLDDGGVRLAFYVDGDAVSTFVDPSPLALGLVGVSAASFTTRPLAVTFRDLRIYGPS